MNQTQYRQAAIELGKIPGMERSPWVLQKQGSVDAEYSIQLSSGHMVPARLKRGWSWGDAVSNWTYLIGPWLLIDDFSDWSAAKILSRSGYGISNGFNTKTKDLLQELARLEMFDERNEIQDAIDSGDIGLAYVLCVNYAYKINHPAMIAGFHKENQ